MQESEAKAAAEILADLGTDVRTARICGLITENEQIAIDNHLCEHAEALDISDIQDIISEAVKATADEDWQWMTILAGALYNRCCRSTVGGKRAADGVWSKTMYKIGENHPGLVYDLEAAL